jgi:hypothetical protein
MSERIKYIREGRMGPPKAFKTGAVVGTYPKPLLVFVFDEEGLSVIPQRGVKAPASYLPLDCCYEDIEFIKPTQIVEYLKKKPEELRKITAVDFCDTVDKRMTQDITVVADRAPFDTFATMLNSMVTNVRMGVPLPWKTIVFDPLTRFNDIVYMFVAALGGPELTKDLRLSYPHVSGKIQQFVGVITALPAHVVVIMHVQADVTKLGQIIETPMFFGNYRQKINSQFTSFFYAVMEGGKPMIRTKDYGYARGIGATFPAGLPDPCQPDFTSIYGRELTK